MNRKHVQEDMTAENGGYAVQHSRRRDVVAAVVCILLAFVVWLFVMNANDTASIALYVEGGNDAYTYTLSAESLEVSGTVVAIKAAGREGITVKVPADVTATCKITPEDLELPEGVALTSVPELTLTVSPK